MKSPGQQLTAIPGVGDLIKWSLTLRSTVALDEEGSLKLYMYIYSQIDAHFVF